MNETAARNLTLDDAVADVEARYVTAHPNSKARYERALKSMPGANTRTVLHYDPFPVTVVKGEGAIGSPILTGINTVDLLGEYTAGLYGHSQPAIIAALSEVIAERFCARRSQRVRSAKLAEVMCARFPAVELVSGSATPAPRPT